MTITKGYGGLAWILLAAAGAVGFAALTPPASGPEVYAWLAPLARLSGDYPEYLWRFILSFTLLGVLPFGGALVAGERPAELGLRRARAVGPWWLWAMVAVASVAVAVVGAYSPGISAYYPYSKTMLEGIAQRGFAPFGLHVVLYVVLYYLPWELLFRGVLVFPVVRLAGNAPREALVCLACLQTVPSALLHVGHPLVESVGSVAFGAAAGYLALASGSIFPGLAIHAGIGVLQDLLLVLRHIGTLP